MKNEGCSVISVLFYSSRWRRLLKLKRKKKTLLRLSLASLSPHHYSQQQRSPFRLFFARQKLSNALKSLKSKKCLQETTNPASERMPFPTSYLQLALAHARNSRVKKEKKSNNHFFFSHCFFKADARGRTCIQLLIGCYSLYINMVRIQWQKNMNSFISFKTE